MRFFEFKPNKPLTPPQARIASLRRGVEVARAALKRERESQKKLKAMHALHKLHLSN